MAGMRVLCLRTMRRVRVRLGRTMMRVRVRLTRMMAGMRVLLLGPVRGVRIGVGRFVPLVLAVLIVMAVMAVMFGMGIGLRQRRHGNGREEGEKHGPHASSPSSGRTVTTLNIPACMWNSRWQWNAQSPGASAVRSNVTVPPGSTFTVCFIGWWPG
jgi:hypothetical protein